MSITRRGRKTKAVQLVPCPTCGQPMTPQLAAMVGQKDTKKSQRQPRRRQGRTFETVAAPIAADRGSSWLDRAPALELGQSEDASPLSPGETRRSTLYHQWSIGDVWVSFLLAGMSGVAAGVPGTIICIAAKTKWYVPLLIWTVPPVIVWGFRVKDFFDNDKAVVSSQEQERVAEPAPVVFEPPSTEIVINSGRVQKRAKLKAPQSDHAGLWKYADALVREVAAPSYEGGKNIFGAKAYGYSPQEFDGRSDAWRPVAITGGILEKDPAKSKGYRLTTDGRRALARVAEHRLGEWG